MKKIAIAFVLITLLVMVVGCDTKPASKEAVVAAKSLIVKATTFFDGAYVAFDKIIKDDKDKKAGKKIAAYLTGDYIKGLKELESIGLAAEKKHPDFKKAAKDKSLKKESDLLRASIAKMKKIFTKIQKDYKKDKDYKAAFTKFKALLKKKKK